MRKQSSPTKDIAPGIVCTAPWRLTNVKPVGDYTLEVVFVDGTHGFANLSKLILSERAGVFSVLRDSRIFDQVFLEYGVATWPGEIDIAPDAMYENIKKTGTWNI